jgi:hypothetical protein
MQYVDINDGTVRLPVDVGGPERLYDVEGDVPRFVGALTRPCADELGLPPTCALTAAKIPGKDSSNARENAWVKAGLSRGNSPEQTPGTTLRHIVFLKDCQDKLVN